MKAMEKEFSVRRGERKRNGLCTQTTLARVFCAACLVLPLSAAPPSDDYRCVTNNGTITLTGYIGSGGAVFIPPTYRGWPVTRIDDYAFQRCTNITSLTIHSNVTTIGGNAFRECVGLTNIVLPPNLSTIERSVFAFCSDLPSITIPGQVASIGDSAFACCSSLATIAFPSNLTSIGYEAFAYCNSLTSLTIPASVTNLPLGTFSYCTSLTAINVEDGNPNYSSVDGVLCNQERTTLLRFPPGRSGTYTTPDTIRTIRGGAFAESERLTSVVLADGITNLGSGAFRDCSSLTNVILPAGLEYLQDATFSHCGQLRSIVIPSQVSRIDEWVFHGIGPDILFLGNAPTLLEPEALEGMVYRLPGATGWDAPIGDPPFVASIWPQIQTGEAGFGVRTNQFGFNFFTHSNSFVVVEMATNLANPVWVPVLTNTPSASRAWFSDPGWTNSPRRFYRVSQLLSPPPGD